MGAGASSVDRDDELMGSNEDLKLMESNDDKLIGSGEDLGIGDVSKMKKKPCAVDPRLAANPRRKAPPINPKTCKEGSVSTGKDGDIYVISGGRWIKAEKKLKERQRELIKERLSEKMESSVRARKKVAAKKSVKKSKSAPKKAASPTPAKRGRGRPKGSTKKVAPKTPARKRCPKGSRKGKSGKCVKK